MTQVRIKHKNGIFSFSRDPSGRGYWYCVEGKVPGSLGSSNYGVIVPVIFGNELTNLAISSGIATYKDLAGQVKKEKKPKTVRAGSSKKKESKLKGSFNPFAKKDSKSDDDRLASYNDPAYLKDTTIKKAGKKVIKVAEGAKKKISISDFFSPLNSVFSSPEEVALEDIDDDETTEEVFEVEIEEIEPEVIEKVE